VEDFFLAALINRHDDAPFVCDRRPRDDRVKQRLVALFSDEQRITERAAQATPDVFGSDGGGEVEGEEFGGDAGEDGRLGSDEPGDEEREAAH